MRSSAIIDRKSTEVINGNVLEWHKLSQLEELVSFEISQKNLLARNGSF